MENQYTITPKLEFNEEDVLARMNALKLQDRIEKLVTNGGKFREQTQYEERRELDEKEWNTHLARMARTPQEEKMLKDDITTVMQFAEAARRYREGEQPLGTNSDLLAVYSPHTLASMAQRNYMHTLEQAGKGLAEGLTERGAWAELPVPKEIPDPFKVGLVVCQLDKEDNKK